MDIREYCDSDPEERERALDVLRAGLEEQAPYTGDSDYAERTLSRLDRKRDWGLSRWWVAVGDDGDIVGVMVMQFDAYECAPLGNCAYLQEVDVVQSAQGRGVGRRLVARAEQEARAAGMDAVLSATHAGNARSRDLPRGLRVRLRARGVSRA